MLEAAQKRTAAVSEKPYEKIIGFSLAMFEHAYTYREAYRTLVRSQAEGLVLQYIPAMLSGLIRDEVKSESGGGPSWVRPFHSTSSCISLHPHSFRSCHGGWIRTDPCLRRRSMRTSAVSSFPRWLHISSRPQGLSYPGIETGDDRDGGTSRREGTADIFVARHINYPTIRTG